MTTPLYCLLGFAAWAMVLVMAIAAVRVTDVLTGRKRADEFPSGVPHGGDRYWRLNRAHINTAENLPIFGAIVLVGTLAHAHSPLYDTLAEVVVVARVVQSLIQISSGSALAVNFRFTAFATQLGCQVAMLLTILRA